MLIVSPAGVQPEGLRPFGIALPALLFLSLGVCDDLLVLRPTTKLSLQVAVATLAVQQGVHIPSAGMDPITHIASAAWIILIVNAFNLLDVSDGLLSVVAAVQFLVIAVAFPATTGAAHSAAGACAAFLLFNRHPASIFLGDAGSHFLGFLTAALTLSPMVSTAPLKHATAVALIVAVPLFELTFVVSMRVRRGLAWWRGSPDHGAFRLRQAGVSVSTTALLGGAFAALAGLAALALLELAFAWYFPLLAILSLISIGAWVFLARHEVRPA